MKMDPAPKYLNKSKSWALYIKLTENRKPHKSFGVKKIRLLIFLAWGLKDNFEFFCSLDKNFAFAKVNKNVYAPKEDISPCIKISVTRV